jgi:hypothetical protein
MTFSLNFSFLALLALTAKATAQGKRGLNYNNATWANYFAGYPQITWGYNWGWPSNGLDSSFEFVPMLWGVPSGADPDVGQHRVSYSTALFKTGSLHIISQYSRTPSCIPILFFLF